MANKLHQFIEMEIYIYKAFQFTTFFFLSSDYTHETVEG